MEVVKIISEHKRVKKQHPVAKGFKRVEAIVKVGKSLTTRHIDIKK